MLLNLIDPSAINVATSFYRQLATNLGFNTGHCSVAPWAANGDFGINLAAAGAVDKYFDIANPSFGPIDNATQLPTYGSKTLLIGNLFLTTYASGITGGATMTFNQFLATGPANPVPTSWFIRKRTAIATDDTPYINGYDSTAAPPLVKVGFSDQYYDTFFSFLRMTVSQTNPGTVGVICEYLFNGIRVDF